MVLNTEGLDEEVQQQLEEEPLVRRIVCGGLPPPCGEDPGRGVGKLWMMPTN